MFLLVLSKNPYEAAELVPDRLKFKQLLELGQLICSAGYCSEFKEVKQGKELQKFIKNNEQWISSYFGELLYSYAYHKINMKPKTFASLEKIYNSINNEDIMWTEPQTAIFRYVKEYAEFTEYESNSELPIDECVECYKKYVSWKEEQFNSKRCKK